MNGMRRVVLFLLLVLLIASQAHAQEPRKVLVLHAYHQGREWTDRISEGIHSVFAPFDHDIHLHFEYLDVQRNNRADYLPALATFYGFKFKDFRFDAVIAADDDALNFVRSYGSAFVPGAPVVFCGVNWSDSETPSMGENETGVVEQLGHQATLSLMLQLHPHCKRILFLMNKEDIQEMFVDQIHPRGFRIGPVFNWVSRWYADSRTYSNLGRRRRFTARLTFTWARAVWAA
ncbi:MAG: hypothetical protein HZB24_00060 [Desulfobacterales bacterium]|nr:hypothetical protein [Desulfobacterales bacterium]